MRFLLLFVLVGSTPAWADYTVTVNKEVELTSLVDRVKHAVPSLVGAYQEHDTIVFQRGGGGPFSATEVETIEAEVASHDPQRAFDERARKSQEDAELLARVLERERNPKKETPLEDFGAGLAGGAAVVLGGALKPKKKPEAS